MEFCQAEDYPDREKDERVVNIVVTLQFSGTNLMEETRQCRARPQAEGAADLPAVNVKGKIGTVIRIKDVAQLAVSEDVRDVPGENCSPNGKRTSKPENEVGSFLPERQIREPGRARNGNDMSITSVRLRRGADYVQGELICYTDTVN